MSYLYHHHVEKKDITFVVISIFLYAYCSTCTQMYLMFDVCNLDLWLSYVKCYVLLVGSRVISQLFHSLSVLIVMLITNQSGYLNSFCPRKTGIELV